IQLLRRYWAQKRVSLCGLRSTRAQLLSCGRFSSSGAQMTRVGRDRQGAPTESPTMVVSSLTNHDPLAQVRSQTAAVIPAYQDEKHIGDIVRRTRKQLDHVLVVDDGSTDQTTQRAREAGAEVIVHNQNRGKGDAIKTGLGHWLAAASPSGGGLDREIAWVILLDSDG